MLARASQSVWGLPLLAGLILCAAATTTEAGVFSWNNRSDLVERDSIEWGGLGNPYTQVAQPFWIGTTVHGWQVGVSKATEGSFERRDQVYTWDQSGGWTGNFEPGDHLLWTRDKAGPISLTLAVPVQAVGMQIQKEDLSSPPFEATIQAFDADNQSLGWVTRPDGYSSNAGDNTAIFLGIRSSLCDIARIEIDVSLGFDFAISRVSIVPEPPQFGIAAGWGLIVLATRRRVTRASGRTHGVARRIHDNDPSPQPSPIRWGRVTVSSVSQNPQ